MVKRFQFLKVMITMYCSENYSYGKIYLFRDEKLKNFNSCVMIITFFYQNYFFLNF